jgi:hypothetical protein
MNNDLSSLSLLATQINELNEQSIHYAAQCGHKLLEAKARYTQGEFNDWIESHCKLTPMQANKYMQAAATHVDLLAVRTFDEAKNLNMTESQ